MVVDVSSERAWKVPLLNARQGQRHAEIFWTEDSLPGGRRVFSVNWVQLT